MRKNILSTLFTKGSIAILNFLIVVITSKYLGSDGRGVISLLVLNITVILLINDLVGGGALVYLVPRINFRQLLFPSYIWGLLSGCILATLINRFHIIDQNYYTYMLPLSILLNFTSINNALLIGREMINKANMVSFVQVISLLAGLFIAVFGLNNHEPSGYFISLIVSYLISLVLGIIFLSKKSAIQSPKQKKVLQIIIKNGFKIQLGNISQLINYRLAYYLLAFFSVSNSKIGVYATGVAICESVWVISNSISMVQYARIANMQDLSEAREITLRLSKISFALTILTLLVLLLLPVSFYTFIFGDDFREIPLVLRTLCLGVASFGLTGIFSHYFSGIGKLQVSSLSSVVGLLATIPLGIILVSRFGIIGAGLTSTISYLLSAMFLTFMFVKDSGFRLYLFLPSRKDFQFLLSEFKTILYSGKSTL